MIKASVCAGIVALFFLQTHSISNACSWNCGGPYTEGNKFGLKTRAHSGFKAHTFFNMPKKDHSFTYIREASGARAGNAYQRFELRDGDCFPDKDGGWNDCETDRERFEFSSRPSQNPSGKQCYAYSIKLDKSFQTVHPTNTDLGQIHQKGGPKGRAGGFKSFPPLIQIGAKRNKLVFGWHELTGDRDNIKDIKNQYELAKISQIRGSWTDIAFCLDFKNERMDVWVNGEKKVELLRSPINFKPKSIYFKYGIYRSFVSRYKTFRGTIPTQIVYFDEIRRGNSIDAVDSNINPSLKPID